MCTYADLTVRHDVISVCKRERYLCFTRMESSFIERESFPRFILYVEIYSSVAYISVGPKMTLLKFII
jgi:hypothetical protein